MRNVAEARIKAEVENELGLVSSLQATRWSMRRLETEFMIQVEATMTNLVLDRL